jgi:hypothetical protein
MKLLVLLLATTITVPVAAQNATAKPDPESIATQLKELRAMRDSLSKQMNTFDSRINALESQLEASLPPSSAAAGKAKPAPVETAGGVPAAPAASSVVTGSVTGAASTSAEASGDAIKVSSSGTEGGSDAMLFQPKTWGKLDPGNGKGFVVARTDMGELNVTLVTYFRYLNQTALAPDYTFYFGNTIPLDLKEDFQLNKVNLTFKGWLYDERFRYLVFIWTNNAVAIDGGQMYLAGNLAFDFDPALTVGAGIDALPSTRSTTGNYPNWLRNDNRLMADEFFRGSFTTGLWAEGRFGGKFQYRVMIANNLSTIGVGAAQLAPGLNTASAFLRWMPSTGEFGPAAGFGDYENHQEVATLFEAHYTYSREDAQEQPNTNTVENSQIRLSDGSRLFDAAGVFGTPYRVKEATYQMAAVDAAVKYKGYALEAEGYARWVNDFVTTGPLPVDSMFDTGLSLQASAMLIDKRLQAHVTFSQIWGQYGNPTEAAFGISWFPFAKKNFRITPNVLWLQKSPVGYDGVPYVVGGQGWVFYVDAALAAF